MAYDLTIALTFALEDGTTQVGYGAYSVTDEDHDEISGGAQELADGAADVAISLGGLTIVESFFMKSDQTISLKINGSATAIAGKVFMVQGAAITALTASNASGSQANLRYQMAGT